jgi:NitT/TauT family transport system substrate-binding protein
VFKQSWANSTKQAINSFFKASKQAKNQLCASECRSGKNHLLTPTDDATHLAKLRQRYCEGGIEHGANRTTGGRTHLHDARVKRQSITGNRRTCNPAHSGQ